LFWGTVGAGLASYWYLKNRETISEENQKSGYLFKKELAPSNQTKMLKENPKNVLSEVQKKGEDIPYDKAQKTKEIFEEEMEKLSKLSSTTKELIRKEAIKDVLKISESDYVFDKFVKPEEQERRLKKMTDEAIQNAEREVLKKQNLDMERRDEEGYVKDLGEEIREKSKQIIEKVKGKKDQVIGASQITKEESSEILHDTIEKIKGTKDYIVGAVEIGFKDVMSSSKDEPNIKKKLKKSSSEVVNSKNIIKEDLSMLVNVGEPTGSIVDTDGTVPKNVYGLPISHIPHSGRRSIASTKKTNWKDGVFFDFGEPNGNIFDTEGYIPKNIFGLPISEPSENNTVKVPIFDDPIVETEFQNLKKTIQTVVHSAKSESEHVKDKVEEKANQAKKATEKITKEVGTSVMESAEKAKKSTEKKISELRHNIKNEALEQEKNSKKKVNEAETKIKSADETTERTASNITSPIIETFRSIKEKVFGNPNQSEKKKSDKK